MYKRPGVQFSHIPKTDWYFDDDKMLSSEANVINWNSFKKNIYLSYTNYDINYVFLALLFHYIFPTKKAATKSRKIQWQLHFLSCASLFDCLITVVFRSSTSPNYFLSLWLCCLHKLNASWSANCPILIPYIQPSVSNSIEHDQFGLYSLKPVLPS